MLVLLFSSVTIEPSSAIGGLGLGAIGVFGVVVGFTVPVVVLLFSNLAASSATFFANAAALSSAALFAAANLAASFLASSITRLIFAAIAPSTLFNCLFFTAYWLLN